MKKSLEEAKAKNANCVIFALKNNCICCTKASKARDKGARTGYLEQSKYRSFLKLSARY